MAEEEQKWWLNNSVYGLLKKKCQRLIALSVASSGFSIALTVFVISSGSCNA